MVGRKRKSGPRHPGGQLVREVHTAPGAIKRLRDAALVGMQDARWATELGRLFLYGRITSDQYDAGCRWAGLASRHSAALGARQALPSGSDFNRSQGTPVDPDSEKGALEAKRHLLDMDRYQRALAALSHKDLPWGVSRFVRELCERDTPLSFAEFQIARCGLDALAEHFGLTRPRKSPLLPK